jgi:type IV secretion system protein TrbF
MEEIMGKETAQNSSPYLNARREWNERYGSYISSMKIWRLTALISLCIAGIAIGGTVYLASQNKLIPYIVEIDREGRPTNVTEIVSATSIDSRIVRAQLGQLIKDFRGVTSDSVVQKAAIDRLYAHLSGNLPAINQVNGFMKENNPYQRSQEETVSIDIHQILPVSDSTWRIEWSEKPITASGEALPILKMTGTVGVVMGKIDVNKLMLNPIGMYIRHIDWSQDLTGGFQ